VWTGDTRNTRPVCALHAGKIPLRRLLGCPWMTRLAEPHSGSASVLIDELDIRGRRFPLPPALPGMVERAAAEAGLEMKAHPHMLGHACAMTVCLASAVENKL